jgi:hypothetical protein
MWKEKTEKMWIEHNENPIANNAEDCAIRAVALALNVSWDDAFDMVARMAKNMGVMPHNNAAWGAVLRQHGFRRAIIPNECPDCFTIKDFCFENPEGVFVIGTGTHAVTVIDGDYYDTWDSGNEIPQYYWY